MDEYDTPDRYRWLEKRKRRQNRIAMILGVLFLLLALFSMGRFLFRG